MEVPHLWIEVTKVSVADISRLCAEGTIGLCFPLTKSTEKTQVWQEIREIFQQALPVRLGEQTVGTARLEEKELRKNLKKEGSVEVMNFEAFLRLERIYA
jgi:hypothetical protein